MVRTLNGLMMHYRSVFISDLHLGTPGCQADALLDFLKRVDSDYLYLVGDIIDGWQLKQRWYWPQAHNDVVQKFCARPARAVKSLLSPVTTMNLPDCSLAIISAAYTSHAMQTTP